MCTTTSTLLVLLAVSFGHATEYGRTLADPGNGEIIPLDVALDPESMIVYPGTPDPPQECFQQSVNLHDFKRGPVKEVTEEWAFGTKVIKPEDVETRFGSLIANFCTGYDVSEMEDGHVLNAVARRSQRKKRFLNINIGCVLCW